MVPMSSDGSDDDDKVEIVLKLIKIMMIIAMQLVCQKVMTKLRKNVWDEDANHKLKATPKTTVDAKVVHDVRKIASLISNKIFMEASQEKVQKKI